VIGTGNGITALVSTIIPTHNRAGLLAEAVQSVLNQSYHRVEIIVTDDGSTDETEARIKSLRHPSFATSRYPTPAIPQ
jgi:glycosyltransferase involved in cell wall biosynthesis